MSHATAALLAVTLALGAAPSGRTAAPQLFELGPIVVADGTATVSGSVGLSASSVNLAVNGQPLALDSNGDFAAMVSLDGASTLKLVLSGATGDTWTNFTIPLAGPGVIPAGVVDEGEHAGAVITAVSRGAADREGLGCRWCRAPASRRARRKEGSIPGGRRRSSAAVSARRRSR